MNDHDKLRVLLAKWRQEVDESTGNSRHADEIREVMTRYADELEAALAALGGKGEATGCDCKDCAPPEPATALRLALARTDTARRNAPAHHRPGSAGNEMTIYCRDYDTVRAAVNTPTQPEAQGEAVAWLHQVVGDDGEPDQALSFSRDSFPLEGVAGYKSVSVRPLVYGDTAAPKPVEGVTEPWYGHHFCKGRDGRWRCSDGCGPVLVEEGSTPEGSEHVRKLIGRIDRYRLCMSYNESYFGEPVGLLKGVMAELAGAVNAIYPSGETALYPAKPKYPGVVIYSEQHPDGISADEALTAAQQQEKTK